jgi:hypothetical protein
MKSARRSSRVAFSTFRRLNVLVGLKKVRPLAGDHIKRAVQVWLIGPMAKGKDYRLASGARSMSKAFRP